MPLPSNLPDLFAHDLIPHIHHLLLDLHTHPYPTIPDTDPADKLLRASVALVLRIQPHYSHWPPAAATATTTTTTTTTSSSSSSPSSATLPSTKDRLDAFFQQDWVRHGDPEMLFIKRAANERDPWSGHIAFPGGRRDASDESDVAVAVRETWEEVGLDLSEEAAGGAAVWCGGLPQSALPLISNHKS
jgi:hypothetical protein